MGKKGIIVLGGIAIVVVAVTVAVSGGSDSANKTTTVQPDGTASTKSSSTQQPKVKIACDILSSKVAASLLSGNLKMVKIDDVSAESDTTATTSCNYFQAAPGSDGKVRFAKLQVRTAKNEAGKKSIKDAFSGTKPASVNNVQNLGDSAYWDNDTRELSVLKGDTSYGISYGSSTYAERTQSEAVKMADAIKSQF